MKVIVSVIVPVFNGEKYLASTIESVLNQKYTDFELIIVNDGSTDKSAQIIAHYENLDARIKSFNQVNSGVSSARNLGIKMATGKYITFLDSDDKYDYLFLDEMVKKINRTEADVVYCGYNILEKNKIRKKHSLFTKNEILVKFIDGKIKTQTATWIIKREYLNNRNILFRVGTSWGEDIEFYSQVLALTEKIDVVPKYLIYYRNDPEESRLSSFSMHKIDDDYRLVVNLINNPAVNQNEKIESKLIENRLSPTITYKILSAYNRGYSLDVIMQYYNKYKEYVTTYYWNNGLRSIKLNLAKLYLNSRLKKIK